MSCSAQRRSIVDTMAGAVPGNNKTFDHLPEEMQVKLFWYLPTRDLLAASLVCRSWRKAALDRRLWKEARLSSWRVSKWRAGRLLEQMPLLRKLTLTDMLDPDQLIRKVGDGLPFLEVLTIRRMALARSEPLVHVAERCTALREIVMENMSTPASFQHPLDIFAGCTKLEKIDLGRFTGRRRPLDRTIKREWSRLSEVTLSLGSRETYCAADKEMEVLADSLGHLRKLRIGGFWLPQTYMLLGQCIRLEELDISEANWDAPADGLPQAMCNLISLRQLSMGDTWEHTGSDLLAYFCDPQVVGRLERLSLIESDALTDTCLEAIADNCPLLTDIALLDCPSISTPGVIDFITASQSLRYIRLRHCNGVDLSDAHPWIREWYPDLHILELPAGWK